MSLSLDSTLGPYEILAKLGSGGMGEVYCARDSRLGRKVAIKVLLPSFTADPDRLSRFEQETRTLALLNHPSIIHIYDTGLHEGMPYLVMELLEGETLRQRMNGRPLPVRKAIEIAHQVARGLAAAHEKGITHRDLKPENIFLTSDEQVKILDFGLAKLRVAPGADSDATQDMAASPSITKTGMVVGTVGYLSPEQVTGRPADARSDIFALGVILWEMLNGARPFRGESAVETMHAILKEDPPELSESMHLQPGLERLLRRCLEKDPRGRFQSAQDLAFHLESLSLPSTSQPTFVQRTDFHPGRSKRLKNLGLLAGGLLLVLGALWAGLAMNTQKPLTLQRVTYQSGLIHSARFAPDGQTYVFSFSRDGGPKELWSGRVDGVGARPLGLPAGTEILSISPLGEMAILLGGGADGPGTLARVPIGGGAPREMLERIYGADWSPDGRSLAVVREGPGGRRRLEYPAGNLVFEAPEAASVEWIRVSPRGDRVAFVLTVAGNAQLCIVDQKGRRETLVAEGSGSLAWSLKGDELLFTARLSEDRREVRAVSLSGRQRLLYSPVGQLHIHDLSRTGRILVDHTFLRAGIQAQAPGEKMERDLSWLQSSAVADLSLDGRQLLFGEMQEGSGPGGTYLRRLGSSEAVRLGDGDPLSLSADGKWAAVRALDGTSDLVLLPTGAGESRRLSPNGVKAEWAVFLRDGKRLLVGGVDASRTFGFFFQRIDTAELQRIEGESSAEAWAVVAPDGSQVAIGPVGGKVHLHSLNGGSTRTLAGFNEGESLLQWSQDGRFLYVGDLSGVPAKVFLHEISSGRRTLWKALTPAGMLGVTQIKYIAITPDGGAYAYSYQQTLTSDLFLIDGWK